MDRRLFFKNLLGGTFAVSLGPSLLSEIVDHPYTIEGKEQPPENVFSGKAGFWLFKDDKLIAYSNLENTEMRFERPVYEIRSLYHPEPYVEYFPGPMQGLFYISDLNGDYQQLRDCMELGTILDMVCVYQDGKQKITGQLLCNVINRVVPDFDKYHMEARFNLSGEAIMEVLQ